MNDDRRQYQRIPVGATVTFQELTFSRDTESSESVYRDVSGGGLLLSSQREQPLGTLLKMEIHVPGWGKHQNHFGPVHELDQRPLVAIGQVVRVEAMDDGSYELGIKFLNVYPDDQTALLKFINANSNNDDN
jgi:c-di-GMP-binding flagellar brake protein YcgR